MTRVGYLFSQVAFDPDQRFSQCPVISALLDLSYSGP